MSEVVNSDISCKSVQDLISRTDPRVTNYEYPDNLAYTAIYRATEVNF